MKKNKWTFWICALAGLAAVCIALLISEASQMSAKKLRMIYIPKIIDNDSDFWTQLIEGAKMAALEREIDITIVAPESEEDYEKQNDLIDWAIGQNPDIIMLSAASYTETAAAAKRIKEANISLIFIDCAVNQDIADVVVATDNIKAGNMLGQYMKQFANSDSEIVIVGHVQNSSSAIDREKGVREGLGEYREQIVDVVFCDSNYDKAYELMQSVLKKHPNISLVVGLNEYSAVGAARAIKDMNKNRIKVGGIDSSLEGIQLLEEGVFEGMVIQNPFKMGYMGVEAAALLSEGKKIEKNMDSGCELITKENVYTEDNQKLLFPFKEE